MKQIFLLGLCLIASVGRAQTVSLQELVNQKRYAEVIDYAGQLTPADSADYPTMNAIGQAYEGVLKHKDAFAVYKHCFSMDSLNIDMMNALARTATNLGRASEAEKYFKKVLETDSTNFYSNYRLGRLYYQLGKYNQAISRYEYLLEKDSVNSVLLRDLGDCYTRLEDVASATIYYFSAYDLNRENASLAGTLINSLLHLGGPNVLDALAICDTALYYNPGNLLLRQKKGAALYQNKQYAAADTLYTELLAEGDSCYTTLRLGGAARYYSGQYFNAIDLLELAYEEDTTSADVCLLLGASLGKTYDRERAFELFDLAEANMQPREHLVNQLLFFRGETYQKGGRYNEAARLYYELWEKTGKERIGLLSTICNLYSPFSVSQYKDENTRQRGLFANVLYVKEFLLRGEDTKNMFFKRNLLESFLEDMFFRSVKEETMIAPDGKRSKITDQELRELAEKLPPMPEKTKREIETARKAAEERQKEREKQLQQLKDSVKQSS